MKVKTDTIIRTILLVIALVNQFLVITGHSVLPFEDAEIEAALTMAFSAFTTLWVWWKNNSFTPEAIKADIYLEQLRNQGTKE